MSANGKPRMRIEKDAKEFGQQSTQGMTDEARAAALPLIEVSFQAGVNFERSRARQLAKWATETTN